MEEMQKMPENKAENPKKKNPWVIGGVIIALVVVVVVIGLIAQQGGFFTGSLIQPRTLPAAPAQQPATPTGVSGGIAYVDSIQGSDSNDCSQSAPCATASRGLQVAGSNGTLNFAEGNYGTVSFGTINLDVVADDNAKFAGANLQNVVGSWQGGIFEGLSTNNSVVYIDNSTSGDYEFSSTFENIDLNNITEEVTIVDARGNVTVMNSFFRGITQAPGTDGSAMNLSASAVAQNNIIVHSNLQSGVVHFGNTTLNNTTMANNTFATAGTFSNESNATLQNNLFANNNAVSAWHPNGTSGNSSGNFQFAQGIFLNSQGLALDSCEPGLPAQIDNPSDAQVSGCGNSGADTNAFQSTTVMTTPSEPVTPPPVQPEPVVTQCNGYNDMTSAHDYCDAVEALTDQGVVSGVQNPDGSTSYIPDNTVTRVAFLKIALEGAGMTIPAEGYYESQGYDYIDDEPNAWYLPYVAAGIEANIIDYNDNLPLEQRELRPSDNVIYAEAAKITTEAFGGLDIQPGTPWYAPYIAYIESTISGTSYGDASHAMTRAESANLVFEVQNAQ